MKYYCDASFSPQHKIAVIAWKSDENAIKHKIIHNTNNISAELDGLITILTEILKFNIPLLKTHC